MAHAARAKRSVGRVESHHYWQTCWSKIRIGRSACWSRSESVVFSRSLILVSLQKKQNKIEKSSTNRTQQQQHWKKAPKGSAKAAVRAVQIFWKVDNSKGGFFICRRPESGSKSKTNNRKSSTKKQKQHTHNNSSKEARMWGQTQIKAKRWGKWEGEQERLPVSKMYFAENV